VADVSKRFLIMLKSVFSRVVTSALFIAVFSPFLKPYSAQAFSFSPLIEFDFYQSDFPNNGFLKGHFSGKDINNDGYISFTDVSFTEENSDLGSISMEYFSGNEGKSFFFSSTDTVGSSSYYQYSIFSKKLTGYTEISRSAIIAIDRLRDYKGMTCFILSDDECSASPLVIQYISDNSNSGSDNNNSGGDSSTKVPEPSIITGFATFSFVLLLKKKNH